MWALGRREPSKAPPVEPARAHAPAARKRLADDLLRRAPLARGVVARLESAPPSASLRVGIYGRSGEGRTTFLQFVEELAVQRGWSVAWFDPWAAATPEALSQAFVSDVLSRFDASPSPGERPATEAPAAGAPAERRLLVLVDDIERLRPETVALMIGGLREPLSLPGCHLVLAMDPEEVSQALATARGWFDAGGFLEKALDDAFWLNALLPGDRLRLLEAELLDLGLDPAQALGDGAVAGLVPCDPRKLRRLLRGLRRLGGVLGRHDPAEVCASPLLWLELMRACAPSETERLLGSPDLLARVEGTAAGSGGKRELLEALAGLFARDDRRTEGGRAEFLRTAEALLDRGGCVALSYWAGVARGEMPAVTPSEARRLLAAPGEAAEVEGWLERQASAVGVPQGDLERALFRLLLAMREEHLTRAAEAELEEDLQRALSDARAALGVLRWLIVEGRAFRDGVLSRADFHCLLDHCVRRAHLTAHPDEQSARDCEREALFAATADLTPQAKDLLDELGVWDPDRQAATAEGGALVGQVCDILREDVAPRVLARFLEPDGISSSGPTERHLLFGPSSALYREDGRAAFAEAAGAAVSDAAVQRNFLGFLRVLHAAARGGVAGVLREDAERLAADRALVRLAWAAATSRRVQPQHRHKLRQVRDALGRRFGNLDDLPAPAWLLEQPEQRDL